MGAALRAGHFDCVKLLIESGVSVDRTVLSGSAKKQVTQQPYHSFICGATKTIFLLRTDNGNV